MQWVRDDISKNSKWCFDKLFLGYDQFFLCLLFRRRREIDSKWFSFLVVRFILFRTGSWFWVFRLQSSEWLYSVFNLQSRLAFFNAATCVQFNVQCWIHCFFPFYRRNGCIFVDHLPFHFIFHTIENVIICNSEPYTKKREREHFFCYFDSDINDKAIFFNMSRNVTTAQRTAE